MNAMRAIHPGEILRKVFLVPLLTKRIEEEVSPRTA